MDLGTTFHTSTNTNCNFSADSRNFCSFTSIYFFSTRKASYRALDLSALPPKNLSFYRIFYLASVLPFFFNIFSALFLFSRVAEYQTIVENLYSVKWRFFCDITCYGMESHPVCVIRIQIQNYLQRYDYAIFFSVSLGLYICVHDRFYYNISSYQVSFSVLLEAGLCWTGTCQTNIEIILYSVPSSTRYWITLTSTFNSHI